MSEMTPKTHIANNASNEKKRDASQIVYATMRPEHVPQVIDILSLAFSTEPTTTNCRWGEKFTREHWKKFISLYIDDSLKREMTVVALDTSTTPHTVAGAFMADDFLTPEPEGMKDIIRGTQMEPEMHAVHLIDEAFFRAHPHLDRNQPGLVCDLWMIGVAPSHMGLGISKGLCKALTKVIRKKGFHYGVMECTGYFSQSMARKCGYSSVYALSYEDFVWEGERVYLNAVPKPHKQWEIFVKDLTLDDAVEEKRDARVASRPQQELQQNTRITRSIPLEKTVSSAQQPARIGDSQGRDAVSKVEETSSSSDDEEDDDDDNSVDNDEEEEDEDAPPLHRRLKALRLGGPAALMSRVQQQVQSTMKKES